MEGIIYERALIGIGFLIQGLNVKSPALPNTKDGAPQFQLQRLGHPPT